MIADMMSDFSPLFPFFHQSEQSRRDDLESLGYMFVYFLNGSLPWQGLRGISRRQKYDKIKERKLATRVESLCRGLPDEFATYLNYVRSLRFDDRPDYNYLRGLFRDLYERLGFPHDDVFDWKDPARAKAAAIPRGLKTESVAAAGGDDVAADGGQPGSSAANVAGNAQASSSMQVQRESEA